MSSSLAGIWSLDDIAQSRAGHCARRIQIDTMHRIWSAQRPTLLIRDFNPTFS